MDYQIAIPSYDRVDIIQTHTLATLLRYKIQPSLITIFVANKKEEELYKSKLDSATYKEIIVGKKGLMNQRHFIRKYYPNNTRLVQMDDDIQDIQELYICTEGLNFTRRSAQYKLHPLKNLHNFIIKAFQIAEDEGAYLWGIYPIFNPYFMSPTYTTDLRLVVGTMWGTINRHLSILNETIDEKEDVERTLLHYNNDNSVLRFNNIAVKTRYYDTKGGMQSENKNRKLESAKSAKYLSNRWPQYTTLDTSKKSGYHEVRLRDFDKPRKHSTYKLPISRKSK